MNTQIENPMDYTYSEQLIHEIIETMREYM